MTSDAVVLWIAHRLNARVGSEPHALANSPMASQRLRIAYPAAQLASHGIASEVATLANDADLRLVAAKRPKIAIFSKVLGDSETDENLERHLLLAEALRIAGVTIVVDVCDHPFIGPTSNFMRRLLALADRITVNSSVMADIASEARCTPTTLIPDPVEGARGLPRFAPPSQGAWSYFCRKRNSTPLKILWFGDPIRSFDYCRRAFPALTRLAERVRVELHLVTAPLSDVLAELPSHENRGFSIRFTPWSRQVLFDALGATDMVLLPADASDAGKAGASNNRLTESIWAGRLVVASGLPSYWEFKDCAFIGDDIEKGLKAALGKPHRSLERIRRGQEIIAQAYTPEAIGRSWVTLCTELMQR